jgi:hypothetical protein
MTEPTTTSLLAERNRLRAIAALLLVLLVAAVAAWRIERRELARRAEIQRRLQEARCEVAVLRAQAERSTREGRWQEAEALLDQARERGGPADLRGPLDQARADLHFLAALEMALLGQRRERARLLRTALEDYGLDALEGDPDELAGTITASDVAESLVLALDFWALADAGSRPRLLELADKCEADSRWHWLRDPAKWKSADEVWRGIKRLDPDTLPSLRVVWFAELLEQAGGPGLRLLRESQAERPGEFWLNAALADALERERPALPAESLPFRQAAVALRPDSPLLCERLGEAYRDLGRTAEADAVLRRARDLKEKAARNQN